LLRASREGRTKPRKTPEQGKRKAEDVIAAFDRQRDEARELNRRHTQHVRASRADVMPVRIERRRGPR
jgi:hypothetical protein